MPGREAVLRAARGHRESHARGHRRVVGVVRKRRGIDVAVRVGGAAKRLYVCTRCLKAGKVEKAV